MGLTLQERMATESPLLADTIEKALANPENPLAKDYQAACWRAALIYNIEEEAAIHRLLEAAKQRELDDAELLALERYLEAKQKAKLQSMNDQDANLINQVMANYNANDPIAVLFRAELTKLALHVGQLRQAETVYQQHQQAPQQWRATQQQFINNVMNTLAGQTVTVNGVTTQLGLVTLPNGQTIQLHVDTTTPEAQEVRQQFEARLDPERSPSATINHPILEHVRAIHDAEVERQEQKLVQTQGSIDHLSDEAKRDRADHNKAHAHKHAAKKLLIPRAMNVETLRLTELLRHDKRTLDDIYQSYQNQGGPGLRLNYILTKIAEQIIKGRRKELEDTNDNLIDARILKRYDNDQIAKCVASIDNSLQKIRNMGETNLTIADHIAKMRLADMQDHIKNYKENSKLSDLDNYIRCVA